MHPDCFLLLLIVVKPPLINRKCYDCSILCCCRSIRCFPVCFLGVVDTTPKDIANIIYSDIMSEFPNITQQYTVSHVNVGPDCIPIEEFEEFGKKVFGKFFA